MAEQDINIGAIFGEVLRKAREKARISQEELAFRAGIDRTFISRLERGVRQPTLTTLIGIGAALDTSPAELVEQVEQKLLEKSGGESL